VHLFACTQYSRHIPWDRYLTDFNKTEILIGNGTSQKPYTLQLHSGERSEYFLEIGHYIFYPVQTFFSPQVCCLMTLSCLYYMALLIAEWLWIIGGMIPTGEDWSPQKKTCHSATMLTANFRWTDLGLNSGLWLWVTCNKPPEPWCCKDQPQINISVYMYICWAISGCLQSALFSLDINIAHTCFWNFPFHAFSSIRCLFNYTNQMHTIYSIHICTIFLLHVSVYLTPSSGRTYAFLTQNHRLLQIICWLCHKI